MKRIAIIAFTRAGAALAKEIAGKLEDARATVSAPARFAQDEHVGAFSSLDEWTREAFSSADALLFVSATGIAVRAVAPYASDKFSDPAVVSIDEKAQFVVPLLSGHVGGANALAQTIARLCGAVAVVSTATDVNDVFAIDSWAREQRLAITDRSLAKDVSAALLEGREVGFASDFPVEGALPAGLCAFEPAEAGGAEAPSLGVFVSLNEAASPFARTLVLVPRTVVLGAGCRKGIEPAVFEGAVLDALARAGLSVRAVCAIATIDVKRDEPAIVQFAQRHGIALRCYSAEELATVPGEYAASEFVRATVGVDNVCERAACASLDRARLIMGKTAHDGVTVAAAVPADYAISFSGA